MVAATAVWFRSKIIVVANVFIYGGIYVTYFVLAPANGWVNLSFAVVALLIARILNWRQELLELGVRGLAGGWRRSDWFKKL